VSATTVPAAPATYQKAAGTGKTGATAKKAKPKHKSR
jgi:hypothetical protein